MKCEILAGHRWLHNRVMLLFEEAASAVGGERKGLREICVKTGWTCLNKTPDYPGSELPTSVFTTT